MTCNNEYGVGWGEVFSVGELVAVMPVDFGLEIQ